MRRLLRDLLRDVPGSWWRLPFAILLAACASAASIALMGVSAWLLSRAAEHPPIMYLNVAVVGVRFFGISRGVFRYTERLVGHDLALRLQGALRLRTYRSLARTTLLGRRRGDLLTRVVADVEAINDLVVRVVLPAASASVIILGTSAMLARFSPASAAVLLVSALLAGGVVPVLAQRATLAADRRAVNARGRLANATRELALGAADLVAYDAEGGYVDRLLSVDAELTAIERRSAWVRGVATAAQILAAGLAVVAAVWIGGNAVATGSLKPRLLAVLVLVPLALHEVLADLTKAATTFTRAAEALRRVREVLDAPPVGSGDREAVTLSGEPGIDLHHVTIGWPTHPALATVDAHIGPGERLAVVGPSGIGKTTLAATVLGLIPPQAGDVDVRGSVGYLAQDAHVFATTVAENIRLANKDASDDEIQTALTAAGLALDPQRLLGEGGRNLSGGEARRLALARLLVGRHDVWILDEPTEHLDEATASAVMSDVWSAIADAPTLVITHDERLAAQCGKRLPL